MHGKQMPISQSAKKMPIYNVSVKELVANGRGASKFETDLKYDLPNSHGKYKANRYQV